MTKHPAGQPEGDTTVTWPPRWLLLALSTGFIGQLATTAWVHTWLAYAIACTTWPVICLVALIAVAPRRHRDPDADHIRTIRGDQ